MVTTQEESTRRRSIPQKMTDENGIVINNDDMEISGDVHKQIGSSISNSHSVAVTVSSKSLPNFNNLLYTIRSDKFTQKRRRATT